MKQKLLIAVLMLCSSPASASEGVIAYDHKIKLGLEYVRTHLRFPEQLVEGRQNRADRNAFWLNLSGGAASTLADTDLGTQFGVDWALRLGVVPNEAPAIREAVALAFDSRLALAFRTAAWNDPFWGSIVLIAGPEFSAGGGEWWSDSARLLFVGGVRVLTASMDRDAHLEVGYVIAPFIFTRSPQELAVRRIEHRFSVSAGTEALGIGVYFTFVDQTVDLQRVSERSLGGSFDFRW